MDKWAQENRVVSLMTFWFSFLNFFVFTQKFSDRYWFLICSSFFGGLHFLGFFFFWWSFTIPRGNFLKISMGYIFFIKALYFQVHCFVSSLLGIHFWALFFCKRLFFHLPNSFLKHLFSYGLHFFGIFSIFAFKF